MQPWMSCHSGHQSWGGRAHLHRFDGAGLSLHIKAPDGSVVCLNGLPRCWPRQARRSVAHPDQSILGTRRIKGCKSTHAPRAIAVTLPPPCEESFCAFADSRETPPLSSPCTYINTPDIVGLGPERGVWLTSSSWRTAAIGDGSKIATLEIYHHALAAAKAGRKAPRGAGNVPCARPSRLLDGGARAPPSIRRRRVVAPHQSPRRIRRVLERPAQMLAASGSQVRLGSRGVEGRV